MNGAFLTLTVRIREAGAPPLMNTSTPSGIWPAMAAHGVLSRQNSGTGSPSSSTLTGSPKTDSLTGSMTGCCSAPTKKLPLWTARTAKFISTPMEPKTGPQRPLEHRGEDSIPRSMPPVMRCCDYARQWSSRREMSAITPPPRKSAADCVTARSWRIRATTAKRIADDCGLRAVNRVFRHGRTRRSRNRMMNIFTVHGTVSKTFFSGLRRFGAWPPATKKPGACFSPCWCSQFQQLTNNLDSGTQCKQALTRQPVSTPTPVPAAP